MNLLKKATTNSHLKIKVIIVFLFSVNPFLFSQSSSLTVYQTEFKNVGKNQHTKQLMSLSKAKANNSGSDSRNKKAHTKDSLVYFNSKPISVNFPSKSANYNNNYLHYYSSKKTVKCPTLFSLLKYYEPIIVQNLKDNNLPKELKFLPVVLSAFNPNSDNLNGGTGFWHLYYPQAVKYGLIVNEVIDERRDFEKSTKAAILYIKDLYKKYNNWELTLTAYSSGVATTAKLLNRHNAKTYNEIYPYLPKDTRDLVQAYVAMNHLCGNYSFRTKILNPVIEIDTVLLDRALKFEALNHVIKTTSKNLKFLNPVLNNPFFPNNHIAYLPKGKGKEFIKYKDSIYSYQDSIIYKPNLPKFKFIIPKVGEYSIYKVKSGDNLWGIAKKHSGVSAQKLMEYNKIGENLTIGQKIYIPKN